MTLNPIPLRRRTLQPDKHRPMDHGNVLLYRKKISYYDPRYSCALCGFFLKVFRYMLFCIFLQRRITLLLYAFLQIFTKKNYSATSCLLPLTSYIFRNGVYSKGKEFVPTEVDTVV